MLSRNKRFGLLNGFLYRESVEREALKRLHALARRVHHRAFLGIKALLTHVGSLNERDDGKVEMAGKGIVAAVVGRHGHDGSCAISGEHIF